MAHQKDLLKAVRASKPQNGEPTEINWVCYDQKLATAIKEYNSIREEPKKVNEGGKEVWITSIPIKGFTSYYSNREFSVQIEEGKPAVKFNFANNSIFFNDSITTEKLIKRFKNAKRNILEFGNWFVQNSHLFNDECSNIFNEIIDMLKVKQPKQPDEFVEFDKEPEVIIEILKQQVEKLSTYYNNKIFGYLLSSERRQIIEASGFLAQDLDKKKLERTDDLDLKLDLKEFAPKIESLQQSRLAQEQQNASNDVTTASTTTAATQPQAQALYFTDPVPSAPPFEPVELDQVATDFNQPPQTATNYLNYNSSYSLSSSRYNLYPNLHLQQQQQPQPQDANNHPQLYPDTNPFARRNSGQF